jgi:SpoVK/Ycf46/Vps4 family AAA+-type ATPase
LTRIWEELYFGDDLKGRLIRYLDIELWLAQQGIPLSRLAARRALLLVGPPGCGKTSLAQTLPNHWASQRNSHAVLIEVNGHTLRSSKLGETERNIEALFRHIREVAAMNLPIFVVVDEVETVAVARASIDPETNPLDVMFGVNAFIEGLDTLLELSNLFWIFTSNLPVLIERAVEERADFHALIPLPDGEQRANILVDALGAIAPGCPHIAAQLRDLGAQADYADLIRLSDGLSARQLRQLVLNGLTLAERPTDLELAHVTSAARIARLRQQHHRETGGVYSNAYQQRTSRSLDMAIPPTATMSSEQSAIQETVSEPVSFPPPMPTPPAVPVRSTRQSTTRCSIACGALPGISLVMLGLFVSLLHWPIALTVLLIGFGALAVPVGILRQRH